MSGHLSFDSSRSKKSYSNLKADLEQNTLQAASTKSNLKKRAISSDLNQELYEKLLSMKPPRITKTAALVENFFEVASK